MCYGMGDPLARSSLAEKHTDSQVRLDAAVASKKLSPQSEGREQWRGEAGPP